MESLSSEARARLAAFRRAESPDRAIADRVLAGLEQRLDEVAAEDADELAARRRRVAGRIFGALAIAAGLLLALTWAVMNQRPNDRADAAAPYQLRDDPTRHVAEPREARPAPAPAPAQAPTAVPEPPVELEPPAEKHVSSDSPKPAGARRAARADDDVAAEVDLLRRAKLAEPAARLDLLGEHARRFPTGSLAAERDLLEIEARCALGEAERARDLAGRFEKRHPGSPLVERAATICDSRPPGP